jgi:hypothetical protein
VKEPESPETDFPSHRKIPKGENGKKSTGKFQTRRLINRPKTLRSSKSEFYRQDKNNTVFHLSYNRAIRQILVFLSQMWRADLEVDGSYVPCSTSPDSPDLEVFC